MQLSPSLKLWKKATVPEYHYHGYLEFWRTVLIVNRHRMECWVYSLFHVTTDFLVYFALKLKLIKLFLEPLSILS